MIPNNVLLGCKPGLVVLEHGLGTRELPHGGMDTRTARKMVSDAKRYPKGHRNLPKTHWWRQLGMVGKPLAGVPMTFVPKMARDQEAPR